MRISGPSRPTTGFTLLELLLAAALIAVLAALLLPALGLVRERARVQEARQTVAQLGVAVRTYVNLDPRHRHPLHVSGPASLYVAAATPTSGIAPTPHPFALAPAGDAPAIVAADGSRLGVLGALIEIGGAPAPRTGPDGVLLDPWRRPYRYQLTRPAPARPSDALRDWNWDATNMRPLAWNGNAAPARPAPFPYIWSCGRGGSDDDATTWIHDP